MARTLLYKKNKQVIDSLQYKLIHWREFDYNILHYIEHHKKAGRGGNQTYNDIIIMADTETSKKKKGVVYHNHVCAWTISLRAYDKNIATLYGHKPSTMVTCIRWILNHLQGKETYIYFHNYAYDYVFLRKFLFKEFGEPKKALNTKPHYPIFTVWDNGLVIKDSLILAQRSLEKWAEDLSVEHQKAVGKWDYDKIRSQHEKFTTDELEYIEHDTLAGVECIQATLKALNKHLYSLPYTATGIPREEVRNRGKKAGAHDLFTRIAPTYKQQQKLEQVYHGGFTHANRHLIGDVLSTECRDFSSSYPYCLLTMLAPMHKLTPIECDIDFIMRNSDKYAFIFKLIMVKPRLKDNAIPMPVLQFSKCVQTVNNVNDNGRILCASYIEIYVTEIDAKLILEQYQADSIGVCEVEYATKEHLPRYFTDYVHELYSDKCKLKGGDPVLYSLAKSKLNALYGLCVQKPCKPQIIENYTTGEYTIDDSENENDYTKYLKSVNSILPYYWGIYCTSTAMANLFELSKCIDFENGGEWVYSDTDSIYATKWNEEKLEEYNNGCKQKLIDNGYGAVVVNNKEFWLGIAEKDSVYTEYVVLGSKRYCGRSAKDGELHITVAGVPKKGAKCLNDDIRNFKKGMVFSGNVTNKKTHTHIFIEDIYIDEDGNETGDSIDLSPCDYLLDDVTEVNWEKIFTEEIEVQVYEE